MSFWFVGRIHSGIWVWVPRWKFLILISLAAVPDMKPASTGIISFCDDFLEKDWPEEKVFDDWALSFWNLLFLGRLEDLFLNEKLFELDFFPKTFLLLKFFILSFLELLSAFKCLVGRLVTFSVLTWDWNISMRSLLLFCLLLVFLELKFLFSLFLIKFSDFLFLLKFCSFRDCFLNQTGLTKTKKQFKCIFKANWGLGK